MRKKTCPVLVTTAWFALAVAAPVHARPAEMSVQVREGQVRASPSFLAAVSATLPYATRVTVEAEKGPWMKVRAAGPDAAAGWMHGSSLTRKRLKISAGDADADVAASSGELALAGKGFNSDVEAEFKERNKDVDFTWVDKMEKIVVPVETRKQFLQDGRVEPETGGSE